MHKMLLTAIATGLVIIIMIGADSSASDLLNGDFESPVVPTNSMQIVTPTSWSVTGSIHWIHNGTVFDPAEGSNWPSPIYGQQFVNIGNTSPSSLSQELTITQEGIYEFTWYDNAHSHGLTSPYSVSIIDDTLNVVASLDLNAAHGGIWQGRALSLMLQQGTYTLVLTAKGHPVGYCTLIDNVALTRVGQIGHKCGDANCDSAVDISDVVHLIAYIFSGGEAPCAGCK